MMCVYLGVILCDVGTLKPYYTCVFGVCSMQCRTLKP